MDKTSAIILSARKFGENKLIINAFTKKYGVCSFMIHGINSPKKIHIGSVCQPLFQNELEFGYLPGKSIQNLKAIWPEYTYKTIPYNPNKISVAFLIAEVLKKVLHGNENSENLYDYMSTAFLLFDRHEFKGVNFHIKFLINLSKYLGFQPANDYSEIDNKFNLQKSTFTSENEPTAQMMVPPYSGLFDKFFKTDFIPSEDIPLAGEERSFLLKKIINYYNYRFDSYAEVKSLDVLQSVYHQNILI